MERFRSDVGALGYTIPEGGLIGYQTCDLLGVRP